MRSFVLAALVVGAWSAPALACTFDPCGPAVRTFGPDAKVPGNLVYFLVEHEPATLSLEAADGSTIPASVRTMGSDRVFAPDAPIAADQRVRLRWSYRCPELNEELSDDYSFKTTAAAEPLTGRGKLDVIMDGLRPWSAPYRTPDDFREGFVDVQLAWSDENVLFGAYEHLFDMRAKIDGRPVASGSKVTVRTPCDREARADTGDTCGTWWEFPPGMHTVDLVGHVIGTDVSLDDSLEVRTTCEQAVNQPVADAGRHDAGVRTLDSGLHVDAGKRDLGDDTVEEDVTPEDSGCHLARGRFDAAYLALGLALLLRRRRQ